MIISIDEQRVASGHARDECKRIHTSLLSASIASWSSIMIGQAAGQSRRLPTARGRVQPAAQWAHDRGSSFRIGAIYVQIHKARG
jgi:hypothetical protein